LADLELAIDLAQLRDNIVDHGRADWQVAEHRANTLLQPCDSPLRPRAARGCGAMIAQAAQPFSDLPLEPPDTCERAHHRVDVLRLEFPAIGQQNQLGREYAPMPDRVSEGQDGQQGRWDRGQLDHQLCASLLDAASDFLFFMSL